jgi:hypothetical protein
MQVVPTTADPQGGTETQFARPPARGETFSPFAPQSSTSGGILAGPDRPPGRNKKLGREREGGGLFRLLGRAR